MNDQQIPEACCGTNCGAADGRSHSPECIVEAAEAQGWSDAPEAIEAMIQMKGLTAPRVTPSDIEANIGCEYFFTAASATQNCPQHESLGLLTFCVLVLKNGFTVTGESACASPENFDAELGFKIARQNAVAKIWPLMGYALKERLAQS